MQNTSAAYKTAIAATDREIRGYIKFNGTFTLSGADGLISFKTTQNAMESQRFCVGSTTSCFCEASFFNYGLEGSGVSLANSYFDAYIGVNVVSGDETSTEYVCCGRYYVAEITRSKDTTRIVGYDIAGRLSINYVPTVTKDPDHGYLAMDILNDIIDQTGVNGGDHFTTFGDDVYVPEIFEGTCRDQWGWLCTIINSPTVYSYTGNREPQDLGYIAAYGVGGTINADSSVIYMDGVTFGDTYEITSFTTGTTENPIVVGNGTGMYGLNPYMTQAIAEDIEDVMDAYSYTPATMRWRGDPALDVMDGIFVSQDGTVRKVVCMKIVTTFNGGLEQTITCYGDSEEYYAMSTSPMESRVNAVSNLIGEIQQAIETADNGVCTKILDTDGTWKEFVIANNQDLDQATSVWRFNINGLAHSNRYQGGTYTLAMDTQGRIVANVIQTGILQDANGDNSWNLDTGAFTITNGSINISTNSETYDVIQLNSGDWHSRLSPLEIMLANDSTNVSLIYQAGGLFWYDGITTPRTVRTYMSNVTFKQNDANGVQRTLITAGNLFLIDANQISRTKLDDYGRMWQYDANGKQRTYLEYGDIYLYTGAGNETIQISSNNFSNGGVIRFRDASARERSRHTIDGVTFYNTSGTTIANYPATHPAPVDKANLTAVSTRGEVLGGYAYQIGNAVLICFHFRASVTATNSPGIADVSLLPDQDCALSCIDITNGIETAIEASVPCGVRYNGKIYLKTITAGHIYAITGVYPIYAA